jgi:hypothetical protein
MATRPALAVLYDFIQNPTTLNASRLVEIPSLHNLLQYEHKIHRKFTDAVIFICKWIYDRGKIVLSELIVHRSPEACTDLPKNHEWYKVHHN